MARFQCNVISYVLKRTVDMTVIVPTATMPECMGFTGEKATHIIREKYPVLYLLHGMGNNHASWGSYSNIELFAEEKNIAVVMMSGENSSYRTTENDKDDFFTFVAEEVPEFVTNMFPLSDQPEHSYIAGLSMGGYGAMLHGLSHPERYAAIGTFSGAVAGRTHPQGEFIENTPLDPVFLLKREVEKGTKLPPIYISCGEKDFLYDSNVEFAELLRENKLEHLWNSVPEYGHEWRFWNQQVEKFLEWIPRTDKYAAAQNRAV